MATKLPQELEVEILLRLPVKSLLKFSCVCKFWYSLIHTSNFISAHTNPNSSNNRNRSILLRCYYEISREVSYFLHSDNESLDRLMELNFPEENFNEFFNIIDSVNGVLCMMDSYSRTNTVLLWNPAIRKTFCLPKPEIELDCQDLMKCAYGFGFDSVTDDYKFVQISFLGCKSRVQIFRLKTGSWAQLTGVTSNRLPMLQPNHVCLEGEGVVHWPALYKHSIFGFDLHNETFREISLPKGLEVRNPYDMNVAVCRGSIAVLETGRREKMSLWVMKEYGVKDSWTKQAVLQGIEGYIGGIRTNGEFILWDFYHQILSFVDPESGNTKQNVIQFDERLSLQVASFFESLLLLNEGKSY